jgi:sphingomyelin phosphodiesterase
MRFQSSLGILLALLGSSLAQGLLNATSLLSLLETATECAACNTVLLALKPIALLGDDAFVNTITAVCVNAHLEDADVCKGAIGSEGPIIAHDLRQMVIPSHTAEVLCTSLLGLCPYPEVRPYQVQFPKPKPNTTRPASSGQPDTLQVVHFSDIHIDLQYETGSNYNCTKPICCRPYTAADAPGNTSYPAGPNGNHKCDTPESLEESMYSAIQLFAPNASFALFTGDIPDHAIWLVNQPDVTSDIQNAYAKMASKLGMPVYATAGNHEAAPVNSFPPAGIIGATSSQWVYDTLSTAWTQWIGAPAAAQADTYGAYAYKVPNTNLRIINLNTNFYYAVNFWLYELNMQYDPNNQLAWLVAQLQSAEDASERVYIIGHMPFGVSDTLRDGSNYLNQIVNRYESTIAAMFFGTSPSQSHSPETPRLSLTDTLHDRPHTSRLLPNQLPQRLQSLLLKRLRNLLHLPFPHSNLRRPRLPRVHPRRSNLRNPRFHRIHQSPRIPLLPNFSRWSPMERLLLRQIGLWLFD